MNRELVRSSFELRIRAQGSRRLGRIHSVYGSITARVPPKRIAILSVREDTAPTPHPSHKFPARREWVARWE
jgi:hypothetical protein